MENFEIHVSPEIVFSIPSLGLTINETQVTLFMTTIIVLVFCLIFRFVLIKRFSDRPGKFQTVIELCVEAIQNMAKGNGLGSKGAGMMAYSLTLIVAIGVSSLFELFGIRGPATDFNFAFGIALMSFFIIFAYGFRYKGIGYLKSFGEPKGFMWPFRFLSELVLPVSLACRLFGNLFAALVVMEIVYAAMANFAVGVPAVLSIYFNLFDVAIQTYIFVTLTQFFVNEAIEVSEVAQEKALKKQQKKELKAQKKRERIAAQSAN